MNGQINVETNKLPPFKYFCQTIGMLPTSYLESMTYYETLVWLCNYLKEVVIPNINNVNEAVSELQNLYLELQTYVNDYFTNLDVQEEINNKLDQMSEDGTLDEYISKYIEPYLLQFNNRLDVMDEKINSATSGSPLVASSTSGMTDTTRIYVNTTDGNWYYYNGTNWVVGGVYQSAGILESSVGLKDLQTNLKNYHLFKTTWIKGSASLDRGLYAPSTNRIRTQRMLYLEQGTLIKFTTPAGTSLRWAYQTFTSPNTNGVENSGWKTDEYFIVPTTMYYCFMISKSDNEDITDEEVNSLKEYLQIYKPILNYAHRLLDWYSGEDPFEIENNYINNDTNDNVKISSKSSYWIVFENMVEFYNRYSWATTRKLPSRCIEYNLGNYGTVTRNNYSGAIVDDFEAIIPNNFCLILNVITGVMSVKYVGDVTINEAVLLRNCLGYGVFGAFKEIYDFWNLIDLKESFNQFETLESSIDFNDNVKAVAHRGYSEDAPENTLPAYKLARQKGFIYGECDISFTADGIPVLLHDATIDRTSNGTGAIKDLTYNEVLQYDFGSWKNAIYAGTKIPTLNQFIDLCKKIGLHPYIELKSNEEYTEAQIQGLVDIVKSYGMENKTTWISFSIDYLNYVKNYDNNARLGYVVDSITGTNITRTLNLKTSSNEVFLDCNNTYITQESINLAIQNNLPVEVWTINSVSGITNMNKYISGVTSNSLLAGKILFNANIS